MFRRRVLLKLFLLTLLSALTVFSTACAGEEKIVEVTVEVEKIVEVEKEVEIEVETISPISYVIIGLGLVAVIVAGILYQRTRQA